MSEIEAIKKYLEWAEERRLAGEPHSIEAYEEAMRVLGLETRIRQVQAVLDDGSFEDARALSVIGDILYDGLVP